MIQAAPSDSRSAPGFRLVVLRYAGCARKVERFLSSTDRLPTAPGYLAWRYGSGGNTREADVLAVLGPGGRWMGMMGVAYRRLFLNGRPLEVALRGDVVVDPSVRGRGLGTALYRRARDLMATRRIEMSLGLVGANVAVRAAQAAGYEVVDRLTPFVMPIDALKTAGAGKVAGKVKRAANRTWARAYDRLLEHRCHVRLRCEASCGFGTDFDDLWRDSEKTGRAIRERSAATLRWQYENRPGPPIEVVRMLGHGGTVGYVISYVDEDRVAHVLDLLARRDDLIVPVLASLIRWLRAGSDVRTLRVSTATRGPLVRYLRRLWFIPRPPELRLVAATLDPDLLNGVGFHILPGDKDGSNE